MSWLSAAFTRNKHVFQNIAKTIPIVGGAAAAAVGSIHTGDEHKDASGQWVSNKTGAPVYQPPSAELQAEIDRVNAINKKLVDDARQAAADSVARVGGGAVLETAARLGPPGNQYEGVLAAAKSPFGMVGIAAVAIVVILLVARK